MFAMTSMRINILPREDVANLNLWDISNMTWRILGKLNELRTSTISPKDMPGLGTLEDTVGAPPRGQEGKGGWCKNVR